MGHKLNIDYDHWLEVRYDDFKSYISPQLFYSEKGWEVVKDDFTRDHLLKILGYETTDDVGLVTLPKNPVPCIIPHKIPRTVRPGYNILFFPGSKMFNKLTNRQWINIVLDSDTYLRSQVRAITTCRLRDVSSLEINAGFYVRSKEDIIEDRHFLDCDYTLTMVGLDL